MAEAHANKNLKLANQLEQQIVDRKKESHALSIKMMTSNELQVETLKQLSGGISGLHTIMNVLNIGENTFLGQAVGFAEKLLSIYQGILAVKEAIAAVEAIGGFLGIFHQGGVVTAHQGAVLTAHSGMSLPSSYNGRKEVMVKALEGEEILTENDSRHRKNLGRTSQQTSNTTNVTINIPAGLSRFELLSMLKDLVRETGSTITKLTQNVNGQYSFGTA
jgi:hypothetical protein